MNIVAVTGATGFIGRHLLRRLLSHPDIAVRAQVHEAGEATLPRAERLNWIRGDLADTSSLRALLEPGCTLINLAFPHHWSRPEHLAATSAFAELVREVRVRKVLHCSTAAVVGRTAAQRVTESTIPEPVTDYEITKLAIESAWLKPKSSHLDVAILRPTAVYGPGVTNLLKLARALHSGNGFLNYLRSSLFNRRRMHLVHVENVVASIEHLLQNPAPQTGEIYIVSDDEDPANNFRDVEKILIHAWGIDDYLVPPFPVPKIFLSTLLRLMGRSNYNPDRVYDASKLQQSGLQKPYRLERGLRDFASWYVGARTDPAHEPT